MIHRVAAGADAARGMPLRPLYFHPDYSSGNPFQTMLHSRLSDVGAEAIPVADLGGHLRSRAEGRGDPGVLALHWTGPILARADGPFRARLLLDRFTSALDDYLDAGGRLVWTVHNVLPHEHGHRWAEAELAQLLADRAHLVHVLSPETAGLVDPYYRLDPAKVVVIEHASYLGYYRDEISRGEARSRLGLAPDLTVLVALGGIRPYKGLDLLLDVVGALVAEDPRLHLLIAGRVMSHPEADRLRDRCSGAEHVTARFEYVPDDEVQVWLKAADLAVLPYRDILNSGAFLLAQTFGLPVVGPRAGSIAGWVGRPHVRLFDPQDPASLAATLVESLAAVRRDPDGLRAHALAAARSRAPSDMASRYARAVQPLL